MAQRVKIGANGVTLRMSNSDIDNPLTAIYDANLAMFRGPAIKGVATVPAERTANVGYGQTFPTSPFFMMFFDVGSNFFTAASNGRSLDGTSTIGGSARGFQNYIELMNWRAVPMNFYYFIFRNRLP